MLYDIYYENSGPRFVHTVLLVELFIRTKRQLKLKKQKFKFNILKSLVKLYFHFGLLIANKIS